MLMTRTPEPKPRTLRRRLPTRPPTLSLAGRATSTLESVNTATRSARRWRTSPPPGASNRRRDAFLHPHRRANRRSPKPTTSTRTEDLPPTVIKPRRNRALGTGDVEVPAAVAEEEESPTRREGRRLRSGGGGGAAGGGAGEGEDEPGEGEDGAAVAAPSPRATRRFPRRTGSRRTPSSPSPRRACGSSPRGP